TVSLGSAGATGASIAVTVTDTDSLAIASYTTTLTVNEGGTAPFGVRLTAQPLVNTTINVTAANSATTASPASVTFTPTNWNSYQTITVTGTQDLNLSDETSSIHLAGGGLVLDEPVTVIDDDMQTLVVSSSSVVTSEGQSATFTVALGFIPN